MVDFYSTYEELKLRSCGRGQTKHFLFLLYLWGIETLKLHLIQLSLPKNFYSTYEELKRVE